MQNDARPLRALWAEVERLWDEREEWRTRRPPVPDEAFDEITGRICDLYWRFVDTPAGTPSEAMFKLDIMLHHDLGIGGAGWAFSAYDALVQIAEVLRPAVQIAEAAVKDQAAVALRDAMAEAKRPGSAD